MKCQCLFPVRNNKDFTLENVFESYNSFSSILFWFCLKIQFSSTFLFTSLKTDDILSLPFPDILDFLVSFLSYSLHCPGKYVSVFLIRSLFKCIFSEFNKVALLPIGCGVYALLPRMNPVPTANWPKRCLSSVLAISSLLTANYYSVPVGLSY